MNENTKGHFTKLREGHILGIISSQGDVLSEYTENMRHHSEFWNHGRIRWRWNFNQSVWWISLEHRPDSEQIEAIERHITRKYGIKFWENGHHDLDHFMTQLEKERKAKAKKIAQETKKNLKLVKDLRKLGASDSEIASSFGISEDDISLTG